jgi:hypothetical protein
MAAKDKHATIEELSEVVFYVRSVPRLYNEEQLRLRMSSETVVRRAGGWSEMAARLGVSQLVSNELVVRESAASKDVKQGS